MKYLFIFCTFLLFIAGCAGTQKVTEESQFSSVQAALIMSADSTTPMRVFSVYNKKDSLLLRTKCEDAVPNFDDALLQNLVKRCTQQSMTVLPKE